MECFLLYVNKSGVFQWLPDTVEISLPEMSASAELGIYLLPKLCCNPEIIASST